MSCRSRFLIHSFLTQNVDGKTPNSPPTHFFLTNDDAVKNKISNLKVFDGVEGRWAGVHQNRQQLAAGFGRFFALATKL